MEARFGNGQRRTGCLVGEWRFTPNEHSVRYEFVKHTGNTARGDCASGTEPNKYVMGDTVYAKALASQHRDRYRQRRYLDLWWLGCPEQTVEKSDVVCSGEWTFAPNTYGVTYELKPRITDVASGDSDRLPSDASTYPNTTVINARALIPSYYDAQRDGTWTGRAGSRPRRRPSTKRRSPSLAPGNSRPRPTAELQLCQRHHGKQLPAAINLLLPQGYP